MRDKYELHKGFLSFLEIGEEGMTEDEATDNRLRLLAESTAIKTVLFGLYGTLVANAEIKSLEDQHEEYKRELWELAKRFIPEAHGEDERNKILQIHNGYAMAD
jgi:hypothetical protein